VAVPELEIVAGLRTTLVDQAQRNEPVVPREAAGDATAETLAQPRRRDKAVAISRRSLFMTVASTDRSARARRRRAC
jgi:hypothetical protein